MGLNVRFFPDKRTMLTSWAGPISNTELLRFYMGTYNHSEWQPGYHEIIDLRDAALSDVTNEALSQLSDLTTSCLNGESLRLALIAPSELSTDLARIYEAFTHVPNESTQVFHHLSEAIDWLDSHEE